MKFVYFYHFQTECDKCHSYIDFLCRHNNFHTLKYKMKWFSFQFGNTINKVHNELFYRFCFWTDEKNFYIQKIIIILVARDMCELKYKVVENSAFFCKVFYGFLFFAQNINFTLNVLNCIHSKNEGKGKQRKSFKLFYIRKEANSIFA